ncbi:hypothetical protein NDU88_003002 [Pleurodeles waltl]|uniref:Uncharacterized protein n=1 Tax=Pleurodeles waltl TaxID=8319 RepID=A0AAV7UZD8_PLEWA|nr:hypothetical protein NDU88_003002 [Pleurodeles waltl]
MLFLHATAQHRVPNLYRVLPAVEFSGALERGERLTVEVPEDATAAVFTVGLNKHIKTNKMALTSVTTLKCGNEGAS